MSARRVVALTLAVVLVYGAIVLTRDVARLQAVLSHYAWWTFAAALALASANYGLRFLKWQFYLRRLGVEGVPWAESLTVFLAGFVMSITPAKAGEVFKSALLASARGVPLERTAPIVIADRLTDLIALIAMVAVGGMYFPGGAKFAAAATALVVGLMVFVLNRRLGELVISQGERFAVGRRLAPKLRAAYEALRVLAGPSALGLPTAISLVAWGCEAIGLWLILRGLGTGVGVGLSTFVYATATLAGALVMLPGGVGGTEATMIFLLTSLAGGRVSDEAAGAGTILVRLATLWFAVLVGAGALTVFRRRYDRRRSVTGITGP